jgi:DNA-binding NarL/FixJ family response regulator
MLMTEVEKEAVAVHPDPADRSGPAGSELTRRERQVLRLLARGLANREIGRQLSISERTVKSHVSQILHKLQVSSRRQAGLIARAQTQILEMHQEADGFGDRNGQHPDSGFDQAG